MGSSNINNRICEYLIYFLFIWQICTDYIALHYTARIQSIDELLAILFLIIIILRIPNLNDKNPYNKFFIYAFVLFLILIVSMVVNGSPIVNFISYFIVTYKPILFFLFILTGNIRPIVLKRVIYLTIAVILFQSPILLYKTIYYSSLSSPDHFIGHPIFGDAHAVGAFCYIVIFYFLGKYYFERNNSYLIAIFIGLLFLVLSSAKQISITLIISLIIFVYLRKTSMKIKWSVYIFSILFIFLSDKIGDLNKYFAYAENLQNRNKYLVLEDYFKYAWREMDVPILGAGPGMFASSVALKYNTDWSKKYIQIPYYFKLRSIDMSTFNRPTSSFLTFLGDIGILGLVIVYYFYFYLLYFNIKVFKNTSSSLIFTYSLIGYSLGINILMTSFIIDVFGGSYFLYLFILTTSILYKNSKNHIF